MLGESYILGWYVHEWRRHPRRDDGDDEGDDVDDTQLLPDEFIVRVGLLSPYLLYV